MKQLGILYVPNMDLQLLILYGGERKGKNLYAQFFMALDMPIQETSFGIIQFTHQRLWDRDPSAPPNLITISRRKKILAVAPSNQNRLSVFFSIGQTGKPHCSILKDLRYPPRTLDGEEKHAEPKPFPTKPGPFARQLQSLDRKNLSPIMPQKQGR